MQSGRIEPLRALPVHREAQPGPGLSRPLEAPSRSGALGGRPAAGPSFSLKEQEDDLFEVGIEGVALNPNRK